MILSLTINQKYKMDKEQLAKLEKAQVAYKAFPEEFKTLQMATVDSNGFPTASYSPYVKVESDYFVYVSELASHTQNLTDNKVASIFFVEDESESKHLFVRRRLSYACEVEEVERGSSEFDSVLDAYAEKFQDKFINMLRDLEDFHLFRLTPTKGGFVNGFGQAFRTTGEGLSILEHKNEAGHRSTGEKTDKQMDALAD